MHGCPATGRLAVALLVAASLAAADAAPAPAQGKGKGKGRGGNQIQIGALGAIDLGRWDGAGPLTAAENHCVTGQPPDGSFALRAVGDGPGGTFLLYDGAATLSYELQYDDGSQRVDLKPGSFVGPLDGIKKKKDFEACVRGGTGENRLLIEIPADNLRDALAGTYSGSLRLMIEAR
jgi:hypothetical protein